MHDEEFRDDLDQFDEFGDPLTPKKKSSDDDDYGSDDFGMDDDAGMFDEENMDALHLSDDDFN